MIQFTITPLADPESFELRCSAIGSDTASKPPYLVTLDTIVPVLMALLRAAQFH